MTVTEQDITERIAETITTLDAPLYNQTDLSKFFGRSKSTIQDNCARVGDGYTERRPLLPTHRTVDGLPLFTYDRIAVLLRINPKLSEWRREALSKEDVRPDK